MLPWQPLVQVIQNDQDHQVESSLDLYTVVAMKGVFDLTLLLLHVYLSHCCQQEEHIAFCQTIPEDFEPGVLTLILALRDVSVINSTVLHNANLSSVTKLTISNTGVTRIEQEAFSSFQNLTSLILDQNLLTHIDPQWLGNPPVLSELSLMGNHIDLLTRSSLRGLRGLKRLSLKKNRIRTISPDAFTDLTSLANLDLSENRLTRIPVQVFRSLESTRMRLDGNPWDCSCAALDFIDLIKGLRRRSVLLRDMEVRCGSPPALRHQPVWNVSTCETPPSSQPQTSDQSRPSTAPSAPPPSKETKTPTDLLETTLTLTASSVSSQPPLHADIVPALIAVIVVLSMLLCAVCALAVISRRKRKSKTVTPTPEEEGNAEAEDADVPSEKRDWAESPHRWEETRRFTGVRAKSADAILSTSGEDHIQTEVEVSSENAQETDEAKKRETETEPSIQTQKRSPIESIPDENAHDCESLKLFENVAYLSIGTRRSNPNRQPGQRSQVGKGMQRISTWPPSAAQWQERRKTRGEDETGGVDAFADWMQRESVKILDVVKNVEQETQDGLRMNDSLTPPVNNCESSLVHVTCSSVSDDRPQTDPSPDQEELQRPPPQQASNAEKKPNTSSLCTEAEGTKGSHVKAGGGGQRRGGSRSTGSKGPPGGGGSPDDDTLLYGNEYTAMDLLHEVVQNNGRWTRERWRQVHTHKQKGQG